MAWVTKSSQETYAPEPAAPELTKKQKAANWWHYEKWVVLGVVAAVGIAAWIIKDTMFRPRPDYQVGVVAASSLPVDLNAALQSALQTYGEDINGDGRVLVQINEFVLDFNADAEPADTEQDEDAMRSAVSAYDQMAGVTRLSADLGSGTGSYLFLLEDPAGFQADTGALQYTDGTVDDPDNPAGDWENMVYRWQDCPVLAGLDLGSYTGETLLDDQTGSGQAYMNRFYVARRGVWDPKQAGNFKGGAALWDALTAGATPLEPRP